MENTELSVKEVLLNSVTAHERAFLDFGYHCSHLFSMPNLEMIHITHSLFSYIVFLFPLILMGSLSSACQTDLMAGNSYHHRSGST